jgi:hypothetical protein
MVGWKGYRDGRGFVPISYEGHGLVLRHDDGYKGVGAASLAGLGGWGARGVTMLGQYTDDANPPAIQRIAIVSGVEGATDCILARMTGAATWALLTIDGGAAAGDIPEADREALWDHAVFPFGCPTRTNWGGAAANITGPCMVMCNADENQPVSPVLVTPNDLAVTAYDELQCDPAITPNPDFLATSVESFDGRMHFLATGEGGIANFFPQRHRWSAVGTAYPNEAILGSGYLDLAEFQTRGLRIESLGNKLALYFEDGVAFQIPTKFYADAYRPQVISRSRGLMGTHALCAISPERHFGIFDDGWWFLDASGRWSEAGRLVLEETKGKSHELTKWKYTFYDGLDYDNKHRTVCTYDQFRKVIRIAYTSNSSDDNTNILNYHWPTDTCWKDEYPSAVTTWGAYDRQIRAGETWGVGGANDIDPGAVQTLTWADVTGNWDSYAPQFIDEVVVHGDLNGLVFERDPSIVTYNDVQPLHSYQTHRQSRNENPLLSQTFHRFGVEYINLGSAGLGVQVSSTEGSQLQGLSLNEDSTGSLQTAYAHFRLHGNHHDFLVAGYGAIAIRSFQPEMLVYGYNDRSGQT